MTGENLNYQKKLVCEINNLQKYKILNIQNFMQNCKRDNIFRIHNLVNEEEKHLHKIRNLYDYDTIKVRKYYIFKIN